MLITDVLIKPVLTEKASGLAVNKVYMFEVSSSASKNQITEALKKLYKVKIDSVRTLMHKGKSRRFGKSANKKQLPDKKIAFVKVSEGEIKLFPQT